MNNIHQVIFNKSTQQFVVVSELAKSARKPKAVSAGSVDIVSILQNFSEKRPLGTTNNQTNRSDNKSSSWSVGVFVGKSQGATGFGVEGAVNVGKGHSNSDSTVQNLTEINSDSLKINTKETTTLKGAVANVKHLSLDTKNLHIESLQDTEKYDSKQTQAGVSGSVAIYGSGWGLSSQASQNKAKVNYAQVNQQSGFNIQESANINVQENTHLKGGMINAQGDKASHQMTTGTLTTEEIENRSDVKVSSLSVSMSSEMSKIATSAIGATLSALGNMRESERSQTKAAISDNINLTITDSEAQKQKTGKTAEETLQSLNRDTTNANQAVKKVDLVAIQEKQETVQVIGELSQSWTNRLVQPHLEEANKKRQEAEQLEKSNPEKSAQLKAEAQAIETKYGLGSYLQMGIRAATAALQGLATGNTNQAAVGLLSPYANKLIKEQTTNADGSINKEANLMAHAVLGAVESHITGNNVAAGALGAFTAEAAAPYLMQAMYGTDKPTELTESQKQNIANLSQIAAGLASGVTGDSTADFISGAEIGKRAVENNYLTKQEAERKRVLDEKAKAGTITTEEELERNAIAKKDIETDLALISVCEENRLSTQCQSERQKLEQAKFSYSGAEYTPTGYNYPTYTRYSDMYSDDYGKVATFSDRYDVLKNAKAKADSDFHNATGIDPSWFGRVDVANNVVASIAGTRLSTTEPSKATQIVPKSASANEKLPVVGKSIGYENQTVYLTGGEYRSNLYSKNWETADLSKAIDKFAGNNPRITVTEKGKRIYENPITKVQVVEDLNGKYFRIFNPNIQGRRAYLDLNGNIPSNKVSDNGKSMGRTQGEYNQVTHFNIGE
ncbi:VENN motif pre-toxin domain-containing protein [Mannheimia sp. ZY171111]|uniref:VENN motif pre-toxin domain-containing protein n=1 Tax=Mannheimia sp. ZY171111 TaxID=2679995 RepID=UPI001ADDB14E|nr:VENN motif pre-toxin domain-containing protein [Mannheimia sp. ZY171111]QTM00435.1 hypothetical protein GM698_01755 [Mannheimia sp. ZY171111]